MNLLKISEMKIILKEELSEMQKTNQRFEENILNNNQNIAAIKQIIGLPNDIFEILFKMIRVAKRKEHE